MEIKCAFNHYCFVVFNLCDSVEFYKKALGFTEKRRVEAADGTATRVYMGECETDFVIELTFFKANTNRYDLGDNKGHIAVTVSENYDEIKAFHKENGWIVREIPERNIHFIKDPDGHVIEILLAK
ncbi:MAG: VOC family protein [Clostridiales bacterium]|jgi:lactoylglutathione lyase|nr:VOC family protein [Clostridiales bacterium]